MHRPLFWGASVLVVVFAFSRPLRSQHSTQTASVPDISGVWMVATIQPALFPKGDAPLQPWAEAKFKANDQGVPRAMFVPEPWKFFNCRRGSLSFTRA